MPLIKCHECQKEVSTEAKSCPSCGARVLKPKSTLRKRLLIVLGIVFFFGMLVSHNQKSAISPEEKLANEQSAKRSAVSQRLQDELKNHMRDPDSLVIESLRLNVDSSTACINYRSKNGFGGMNREFLIISNGHSSTSNKDWNKNCTKPMFEMIPNSK